MIPKEIADKMHKSLDLKARIKWFREIVYHGDNNKLIADFTYYIEPHLKKIDLEIQKTEEEWRLAVREDQRKEREAQSILRDAPPYTGKYYG